jgi:Right handed beta helix region
MKTRGTWIVVALCLGASVFVSATAGAVSAQRTFVSAQLGNDANACTPTSPCRTFAHAISLTAAGGEVIALDSGGYGAFTISQAVSIIAPQGVYAGISVFSGDGIGITVGSLDAVILRGLTINGLGGANGINFMAGGIFFVENCNINGFSNAGLLMGAAGDLAVRSTNVRLCPGTGIQIANTTGRVSASINECHLDENGNGFQAQTSAPGSSYTTVTHSTADLNFTGWICGNASSGQDTLNLEWCTASRNGGDGLFSDSTNAGSALYFSYCVITNNGGDGVGRFGSGQVVTRGNNTNTGNFNSPSTGTINSYSPF